MGILSRRKLSSALTILSKMVNPTAVTWGYREMFATGLIGVYTVLCWVAPNAQAIMNYDHEARTVGEMQASSMRPPAFLCAAAAVLAFGVLEIQQHSEFIYFRF